MGMGPFKVKVLLIVVIIKFLMSLRKIFDYWNYWFVVIMSNLSTVIVLSVEVSNKINKMTWRFLATPPPHDIDNEIYL